MVIDVLIVDDSREVREILKMGLEDFSGFKIAVEAVESSEQARAIEGYRPKVVILDYSLRTETPDQALKTLREKYPKAQIIGYSGHPRAIDLGYNAFMVKPVPLQMLVEKVYQLAKNVAETGENPQLYL